MSVHNVPIVVKELGVGGRLHLFQDRKLQPSTIDGYRMAIVDMVGTDRWHISKDVNLTCLVDSFHPDKPRGRRGVPS